jgi:predicted enzyme related to lactoylglutathione lyase
MMVAGIMKRPENVPETPPMWLPYFMVESIDGATAKASELGGTVLMEPMAMPGIGTFALVQDAV